MNDSRKELPPVKTYAGGKPNYCTPEVPCKTHPDAPHGFDRNASHNLDRYVCECEGWEPVDNVDISEECVHKTDKFVHEPLCYLRDDIDRPFGGFEHCDKDDAGAFPVYLAPPKRDSSSWVGLTDEERFGEHTRYLTRNEWALVIEAKLKKKNT